MVNTNVPDARRRKTATNVKVAERYEITTYSVAALEGAASRPADAATTARAPRSNWEPRARTGARSRRHKPAETATQQAAGVLGGTETHTTASPLSADREAACSYNAAYVRGVRRRGRQSGAGPTRQSDGFAHCRSAPRLRT